MLTKVKSHWWFLGLWSGLTCFLNKNEVYGSWGSYIEKEKKTSKKWIAEKSLNTGLTAVLTNYPEENYEPSTLVHFYHINSSNENQYFLLIDMRCSSFVLRIPWYSSLSFSHHPQGYQRLPWSSKQAKKFRPLQQAVSRCSLAYRRVWHASPSAQPSPQTAECSTSPSSLQPHPQTLEKTYTVRQSKKGRSILIDWHIVLFEVHLFWFFDDGNRFCLAKSPSKLLKVPPNIQNKNWCPLLANF